MYSMDEFLRFQSADALRNLNKAREKAGVRVRARSNDVNAFLSACGLKAKRR